MSEIQKTTFETVYNKLERGELTPYNFYNVDLSPDQVFAIDHYLSHPNDTIEKSQKLKKVFYDIEVFLNHKQGKTISDMIMQGVDLVNSISHYYSSENKFYCYMVPPKGCNITKEEFEEYLTAESNKDVKIGTNDDGSDKMGRYFEEGQTVEVQLFENGIDLVIAFWEKVKRDDPAIYSGWNSAHLTHNKL